MTDHIDVIAAFADEEPVAASDLSTALAREDARAYLIDVLALRGLVTDAKPQTAAPSQVARARRRWSSLRIAAAAALIVVGVGAGFTVGWRSAISGGREGSEGRGGSGGREAETVTAVPAAAAAPAAPAPTHVFRMENGVNWNERAGGN